MLVFGGVSGFEYSKSSCLRMVVWFENVLGLGHRRCTRICSSNEFYKSVYVRKVAIPNIYIYFVYFCYMLSGLYCNVVFVAVFHADVQFETDCPSVAILVVFSVVFSLIGRSCPVLSSCPVLKTWLVVDELRCWAFAWVLQLCCCAGRWCRLPSSSPSRTVAWKLLLLLRWVLWLPWQEPCQLRPWRARLLAQTCAPSLWSTWSTHCATLSSWCARSTTSPWSWASSRHWSPSSTWSCLRLSQMRTSEWDRPSSQNTDVCNLVLQHDLNQLNKNAAGVNGDLGVAVLTWNLKHRTWLELYT